MIELKQITETFGDSTSRYSVTLDKEYTVKEFINDILTRNEWGYIGIYKEGQAWFDNGDPNCEYKQDILISELPEEYLSKKIVSVKASGGWSRMDYLINLDLL